MILTLPPCSDVRGGENERIRNRCVLVFTLLGTQADARLLGEATAVADMGSELEEGKEQGAIRKGVRKGVRRER